MLTLAEVQGVMPANLRGSATQELVDLINQIATEPEATQAIRDNFVSYASVLKDGKFKTEDYVNAVVYVSYISGIFRDCKGCQKATEG